MPTCAVVGRSPISVVAMPIMSMEVMRTPLRPSLSPKWPNTTPPMGRARYPTARVENEAKMATAGSRLAKKTLLKTREAAVA